MEVKMIYVTMVISLMITILIEPVIIPLMRRLKYGQAIRIEGPQHHRKKAGTPTMGGVVFVIATVTTVLIYYTFYNDYYFDYSFMRYVLLFLPFISFSVIGFIDDYLIVVKKNNLGLSPKIKLMMEILVAAVFFMLYLELDYSTAITLFGQTFDFAWFYGVVIFFMIVGSANAVNLTDGLDGLAGGLVAIAVATFTYVAFFEQQFDLMIVSSALLGSILGFLIFNMYPAKIIMGDTGSLALGAFLATIAILLKYELLLILVGGVFIIETLSVILQVLYFKKTRGKRLFKMSPIHHHFELSGLNESQVVLLFYTVGFILSFISLYLIVF